MVDFSFSAEILPALHQNNAAFTAAMTKVKESLGNLEVIRCFAYHYDPPENFKTLYPPSIPGMNVSQEKLVEIQTWLRSLSLTIIPADLPGMHARYDYNNNRIDINVNLFNNSASATGVLKDRYAFLIWRKILHEVAHWILYVRHLQAGAAVAGHMTPPGFFHCESGNTFENLFSGGIFNHRGNGMASCSEVHVRPMGHDILLAVPDTWISAFFAESVKDGMLCVGELLVSFCYHNSAPPQAFRVDLTWPLVVVGKPSKRKRAVIWDDEPDSETVLTDADEEYEFEIHRF